MSILRSYSPVFKFVAIFAGLYIVLSLLYYGYKAQDWTGANYPDPITSHVSHQTNELLNLFGYPTRIENTQGLPSVNLIYKNKVLYRIIEGCNAVSVMILFLAFVLAFAKAWKKTILFSLFGFVLIYLANLFRLVVLAIVFVDYPEYSHAAHDLVFPAIIYGMTILLWLYWIRKPKKA